MRYETFDWYKGNLSWLRDRTILLTKAGSHAYGTNLPTSDVDLRGLAIPPREYYLGNLNKFEQAENKGEPDVVIYGINKFIEMASKCNPNILEILFIDESDWIIPNPKSDSYRFSGWRTAWCKLIENRQLFVTKQAQHTFGGYAISQLKRIKSHRKWLLDPPKAQPKREDFGLPANDPTIGKEQLGVIEARIRKLTDDLAGKGWTKDRVEKEDELIIKTVVEQLDISPNLVEVIFNERRYNAASRNWVSYLKWKEERNPIRYEMEARWGFDCKHAMHLVRLLLMAKEILGTGQVIVKRHDAKDLLDIRNGKWTYNQLMDFVSGSERGLQWVADCSKLPHSPDRVKIDKLLMEIVEEANFT